MARSSAAGNAAGKAASGAAPATQPASSGGAGATFLGGEAAEEAETAAKAAAGGQGQQQRQQQQYDCDNQQQQQHPAGDRHPQLPKQHVAQEQQLQALPPPQQQQQKAKKARPSSWQRRKAAKLRQQGHAQQEQQHIAGPGPSAMEEGTAPSGEGELPSTEEMEVGPSSSEGQAAARPPMVTQHEPAEAATVPQPAGDTARQPAFAAPSPAAAAPTSRAAGAVTPDNPVSGGNRRSGSGGGGSGRWPARMPRPADMVLQRSPIFYCASFPQRPGLTSQREPPVCMVASLFPSCWSAPPLSRHQEACSFWLPFDHPRVRTCPCVRSTAADILSKLRGAPGGERLLYAAIFDPLHSPGEGATGSPRVQTCRRGQLALQLTIQAHSMLLLPLKMRCCLASKASPLRAPRLQWAALGRRMPTCSLWCRRRRAASLPSTATFCPCCGR